MNDSDHLFASVIAGRVGVVTVAPDGTTYFQAIGARKPKIENDQGPVARRSETHSLMAVTGNDDLIAKVTQIQSDQLRDILLVFNQ